MKKLLALLLVFSASAYAQQPPESVTDASLTCEVSGHSFVLGQADFKALSNVDVTPPVFKALPLNSKKRIQICTTRYVWRLIAAGRATQSDTDTRNGVFVPLLLSDDEIKVLNNLMSGWLADKILAHKDQLLPGR
jgi:hypothetical protein